MSPESKVRKPKVLERFKNFQPKKIRYSDGRVMLAIRRGDSVEWVQQGVVKEYSVNRRVGGTFTSRTAEAIENIED